MPGIPLSTHCYGPRFPASLPASLTFSNSSGAVLDCRPAGEPPPSVAWVYRNTSKIYEFCYYPITSFFTNIAMNIKFYLLSLI